MKKVVYALSLFAATALVACGGDNTNTENNNAEEQLNETEETVNTAGMHAVDLIEYDIAASIMVPDDTKGKTEISATDFGSVQIIVGKRFGVEIVPFGMFLDEAKDALVNSVLNNEITEEGDNFFVYKQSIPDGNGEEWFHFFYNAEVNGEVYEIKSLSNEKFKASHINKMLTAAKTFK